LVASPSGIKLMRNREHEVDFDKQLIGVLVDADPGAMRSARWSTTKQRNQPP